MHTAEPVSHRSRGLSPSSRPVRSLDTCEQALPQHAWGWDTRKPLHGSRKFLLCPHDKSRVPLATGSGPLEGAPSRIYTRGRCSQPLSHSGVWSVLPARSDGGVTPRVTTNRVRRLEPARSEVLSSGECDLTKRLDYSRKARVPSLRSAGPRFPAGDLPASASIQGRPRHRGACGTVTLCGSEMGRASRDVSGLAAPGCLYLSVTHMVSLRKAYVALNNYEASVD